MSPPGCWAPLPFPPEVHRERIDRVREECARRRLDGLLLFAQESLYYLFGYDQIGYWVYQVIYLPQDGRAPVAICRPPDADAIAQSPLIGEVRVWTDDQHLSPADMTVKALGEVGAGRVGVELRSHSLLPAYWSELRSSIGPGVEVVDASDLVASHRVIKDEYEIERFRQAAEHLATAYAALENRLAAGVRECDLLAAAMEAMLGDGAGPPAIQPPIASGPRTMTQTHGPATGRLLGSGDPVVAEIGASSSRYHAVGVRSYVLGAPSRAMSEMHAAACAALEAGFDALEPGGSLSDVARLAQAELHRHGHSRAGRHVGYGTGIGYPPTWLEELRIKASDHTEARPGMTLFYFIGLADSSRELCLYVGEPVLITETGAERVAPYAAERWRR